MTLKISSKVFTILLYLHARMGQQLVLLVPLQLAAQHLTE